MLAIGSFQGCERAFVARALDSSTMRIMNVAVERIGTSRDGRDLLIGRGRDVVTGWTISFIVPAGERDRILREVRGGRQPMVPVPEVDALPFSSVSGVVWE